MASVPTPNYILTQDYAYMTDSLDQKVIKAGSFVRPIEFVYVPQHVRDSRLSRWFDPSTEVFCYTPVDGILPIPKKMIRKV